MEKATKKSVAVAKTNIKKANLKELIQKKKECERKAHEIVLRLIDSPPVDKDYLIENAIKISKHHMDDVTEERRLAQLCGWVLCPNSLDPKNIPRQTYSIRGHRVFDITERKAFCCGKCYAKAHHFKSQLLTSPLWLREIEENVTFEVMQNEDAKELHGISVEMSSVKLENSDSDSEEDNHVEVHPTDPAINTDLVLDKTS